MKGNQTGLAPEVRALMATVRDDDPDLERELLAGPRWPVLLRLSEAEKATPVLHRRIAALQEQGIRLDRCDEAAGTLESIRQRARIHQFRLQQLERRLDDLLAEYHRVEIPVVLLKGSALRRAVYGSAGDRPMADVDLLVKPEMARAAWDAAQRLDWRRRPWGRADKAYETHHHLPPMIDAAGLGLSIEIHTEVFKEGVPLRLPAASIWKDARTVEEDSTALIPCPEHLLLHAALHLTWSHLFRFRIWKTFRDLNALISVEEVDWDRFLNEAREARGSAGAFWALYLAREWAGVPVEEAVLDALRPSMPEWLRRALLRHFALRILPPGGAAPPGALHRRRIGNPKALLEREGR